MLFPLCELAWPFIMLLECAKRVTRHKLYFSKRVRCDYICNLPSFMIENTLFVGNLRCYQVICFQSLHFPRKVKNREFGNNKEKRDI